MYTRSMKTIYLSVVHTGSWGYLFYEVPSSTLFVMFRMIGKIGLLWNLRSIKTQNIYFYLRIFFGTNIISLFAWSFYMISYFIFFVAKKFSNILTEEKVGTYFWNVDILKETESWRRFTRRSWCSGPPTPPRATPQGYIHSFIAILKHIWLINVIK